MNKKIKDGDAWIIDERKYGGLMVRAFYNDRHNFGAKWMFKWPFTEIKSKNRNLWESMVASDKAHPNSIIGPLETSRHDAKRFHHHVKN